MAWIAEHVPWYQVDKSVERPWRDEDMAMSAPEKLGEFRTEDEARKEVAAHLVKCSNLGFIQRAGEGPKYVAAGTALLFGVDGVRLHGRFYRVREV